MSRARGDTKAHPACAHAAFDQEIDMHSNYACSSLVLAASLSLTACFAEPPQEIDYEAEALGGYPEERGDGVAGVEPDASEVIGVENEAAAESAVAWGCSRDGSNRCVGTCPGAMVCAAIGTFTPRPGGPSYNRCACVAPSVRVLQNQGVN